jgi:hypothetical protein
MLIRPLPPCVRKKEFLISIAGIQAVGNPVPVARSFEQTYKFSPDQECKLAAGKSSQVTFSHKVGPTLNLTSLDSSKGTLTLKASQDTLNEHFDGDFPKVGSLLDYELVNPKPIPNALANVGTARLAENLPEAINALLHRTPPSRTLRKKDESFVAAAIRVTESMDGGCLVIQGPPGTGKTYTASHVIQNLLSKGMKVGVTSNSHKAITNLLLACSKAAQEQGKALHGIKVGGEAKGVLFTQTFHHVEKTQTP